MYPSGRDKLRQRILSGEKFHFHLFYGHKPAEPGKVCDACFSQWFERSFEIDGVVYPTAEHWMMAEKARLFGDLSKLDEILVAPDPKTAKARGRQVTPFDKKRWDDAAEESVCKGNGAKFQQNPDRKEQLLGTQGKILVEAAPRDQIWGIGFGAKNEKALDPLQWRGRNKLGFVLTRVREELSTFSNAM